MREIAHLTRGGGVFPRSARREGESLGEIGRGELESAEDGEVCKVQIVEPLGVLQRAEKCQWARVRDRVRVRSGVRGQDGQSEGCGEEALTAPSRLSYSSISSPHVLVLRSRR